MENYKRELEKLNVINARIKGLEERENALINKYCALTLRDRVELRKTENADYIATEKELKNVSDHINDLKIAAALTKSNIKIALFEDVAPVVADIWNKYAGKHYGEQTRKKIYEEIKSATSCTFWINNRYCEYFEIAPLNEKGYSLNEYNISFTMDGGMPGTLLKDNVIQPVNAENIKLWFTKTEKSDTSAAGIKKIKAAYLAIVKAQNTLNDAIEIYDALTVEGLPKVERSRAARDSFLKA